MTVVKCPRVSMSNTTRHDNVVEVSVQRCIKHMRLAWLVIVNHLLSLVKSFMLLAIPKISLDERQFFQPKKNTSICSQSSSLAHAYGPTTCKGSSPTHLNILLKPLNFLLECQPIIPYLSDN